MVSALKWLIGSDGDNKAVPTTKRGLPSSWYRSPEMYELERRAIFSKKWILVTHRNRFVKSGDFLRITEAGFSFILCLDREGNIGGFHNACRHRGFPLIHDDEGNVKILSCKYHGWSYGLNGKLAKAPQFESFADFDKTKNGLYPVHVHIDALGFVWVNLQASEKPSISWEEQFNGVDTQSRFKPFDFTQYRLDHTWGMQGNYNWKTLADNYNECLHCKTSHPDVKDLIDIEVYKVEGKDGHLQHYNKREREVAGDIKIASTYYFPNACMTVSKPFFYMMRCVPTSATTVSMEYEVYRHKDAEDEEFTHLDQLFKRVLSEDKWLCENTQKSFASGIYQTGPLHPQYEEGPLYFQSLVKNAVMEHRKEEERQKRELWPAARHTSGTKATDEEEEFCSGLSCGPDAKNIAW